MTISVRVTIFFSLTLLVIAVSQTPLECGRLSSSEWQAYKKQFGKIYATQEEDSRRYALFLEAKQRIERHHARDKTNRRGPTPLSDMSADEVAWQAPDRFSREPTKQVNSHLAETFLKSLLDDKQAPPPAEMDWRKVPGRITPVRAQGACQAGWAMATLGALEGQQLAKNLTATLTPLSVQQLVDCSLMNHACDHGTLYWAFNDIQREGGIMSEADYPYAGRWRSKCGLNQTRVVMTDAGSAYLPYHDEKTLMKAVARYGPIPTQVYVTHEWHDYKSGLLIDDTCRQDYQNHAILLVGYGSDPTLGDYWIAKNSYGIQWGEDGYLKIQRGVEKCGIGFYSNIPLFNDD